MKARARCQFGGKRLARALLVYRQTEERGATNDANGARKEVPPSLGVSAKIETTVSIPQADRSTAIGYQ